MKEKKGTKLKDLTPQELQERLSDERSALHKLRFAHAVSPIENPMQLRFKRKEVARILTELRKRETATSK